MQNKCAMTNCQAVNPTFSKSQKYICRGCYNEYAREHMALVRAMKQLAIIKAQLAVRVGRDGAADALPANPKPESDTLKQQITKYEQIIESLNTRCCNNMTAYKLARLEARIH